MKIENVYKCLRCGKLVMGSAEEDINVLEDIIPTAKNRFSLIPENHHCDPTNNKQIGILQRVGFNVISDLQTLSWYW